MTIEFVVAIGLLAALLLAGGSLLLVLYLRRLRSKPRDGRSADYKSIYPLW